MRLDKFIFEKGYVDSRAKAQQLIKNGLVYVNDKVEIKPSFEVLCNEKITISNYHKYVSRGAYKLLTAISKFDIDFKDKVVADIGASTGGFTQVALEHGAKKVYAIDVGRGELSSQIASDERVVNLENTDFRVITKDKIKDTNLVIGDISFISLRHIMPKIKELFGSINVVILFKPQFECGKELAKKYKGVIKNRDIHKNLLKEFIIYINSMGYKVSNLTYSSIMGKSGNIEYLFYINGENQSFNVEEIVDEAFNYFKNKKDDEPI